MQAKKRAFQTTLGLGITVARTQLYASVFALNEQSISGMGLGFSGRSSSAEMPVPYPVTLRSWLALKGNRSPAAWHCLMHPPKSAESVAAPAAAITATWAPHHHSICFLHPQLNEK